MLFCKDALRVSTWTKSRAALRQYSLQVNQLCEKANGFNSAWANMTVLLLRPTVLFSATDIYWLITSLL